MIRHHHHFEALLYQSAGSPSPFYLAASFCLSCLSASALCPERLGEIWIITPTKAYCKCSRRPTRAASFNPPAVICCKAAVGSRICEPFLNKNSIIAFPSASVPLLLASP